MSYSAPNRLLMPARHSIDTMGDSWLHSYSIPSNGVWPSANLAIYVPLRVPSAVIVRSLWFGSSAVGTGNVDMALYNAAGVGVIAATNAAKLSSATEQVFDVTDTLVPPGLYYIGLSSDSGTDTFYYMNPAAPCACAAGVLTEAAAYPLPSTATWALDQALAYIPVMGLLLNGAVT